MWEWFIGTTTAKLWGRGVIELVPIDPVIGTLLGVFVGQMGALLIGRANAGAQVKLANENARREHKLKKVQPLLDRSARSLARYRELVTMGMRGGKVRLEAAWDQMIREDPLADVSYISIPGPFRLAVKEFAEAEEALLGVCIELLKSYDPSTVSSEDTNVVRSRLDAAAESVAHALIHLNQAAQVYAFGEEPAPRRWRLPWPRRK
jgi:hypothetical protein